MNLLRSMLVFMTGALVAVHAVAQYPNRPIRLIVPFPAGGAVDAVTRILAEAISPPLGQRVFVDFKPGADGQVAGIEVRRSTPDGYTLFVGTASSLSYVPVVRKSSPYDPLNDFTPLSTFFLATFFLYVHPDVPAKSLRELIDYARANPGKLSYGTGNATGILATAELLSSAKVEMVHIPYKGEISALTELLSSRIQLMIGVPAVFGAHAKDGKLRVLATTSPERSPLLPDVPTLTELGLPASTVLPWAGIFGPRGLPKEVADRLSREIKIILARPDVRAQIEGLGFAPLGSAPDELGILVKEQAEVWRRAVHGAGLVQE